MPAVSTREPARIPPTARMRMPRGTPSSTPVVRRVARPQLYPPSYRIAILLALLSLVVPLLGPVTWVFAQEQLDRVSRGFAARRGVGYLVVAKVCGIFATYAMIATIAAVAVVLFS